MRILCVENKDAAGFREFSLVWEKLPEEARVQWNGSWNEKDEPTWVLLECPTPKSLSQADFDAWKRRFPISALVAVQGSLCEGELTLNKPLGAHWVFWYDFLATLPREYEAGKLGRATVWALPETAQRDARVLADLERERRWPTPPRTKPLNVRIETDDFAQFALLRDFFQREKGFQGGVSVIFEGEPEVLLFDFPDFRDATRERFLRLRKDYPQAKPIALLEFPRLEEWQWCEANGASVFPKPFRWTDLRRAV